MILVEEFQWLQSLTHGKCTFDAACSDDGTNSLCNKYASAADSFLKQDIAGHFVWINPPYNNIHPFLKHYAKCKQDDPDSTAALILVPDWGPRKAWRRYLQGMTLLHTYPQGSILFTQRTSKTNPSRIPMGPTPWPVQVYYDPPGILPEHRTHLNITNPSLTMLFKTHIGKQPATTLVDSGASENFITAAFAEKLGCKLNTSQYKLVQLADNKTVPVQGLISVHVKIGNYQDKIKANVLPTIVPGVDLILGDKWTTQTNVVLDYPNKALHLRKDHNTYHLYPIPAHQRNTFENKPSVETLILEGKKARKAIRNNPTFLVVVEPDVQHHILSTMQPCPHGTQWQDHYAEYVASQPEPVREVLRNRHNAFMHKDSKNITWDMLNHQKITPEVRLEPGHKPPFTGLRRLSQPEIETAKQHVTDLLERGLIEPCNSPYGAQVLFVQKKDKSLRLVVDLRQLNKIAIPYKYPLNRIDDVLDSLQGAKYFSSLDCSQAFFQCVIPVTSREATAFRLPWGQYCFKILPMGYHSSPAIWTNRLNELLKPYIGKFVVIYMDDIAIYSKTLQDHLQHIDIVLKLLEEDKLFVSTDKSSFLKPSMDYVGFVVDCNGVSISPTRIETIKKWPVPNNKKELRGFLGLTQFVRKFILGHSIAAAPLTSMTGEKATFTWGKEQQHAFDLLKRALTSPPILALPQPGKPYTIISDACITGCGAILMQEGKVIAYFSKKFTPEETKYITTDQELAGIMHALEEWRCYVEGQDLELQTDHCPLTHLNTQPQLSRKQARWMETLETLYRYKWKYIPGRINAADPISRYPPLAEDTQACVMQPDQPVAFVTTRANNKRHKVHHTHTTLQPPPPPPSPSPPTLPPPPPADSMLSHVIDVDHPLHKMIINTCKSSKYFKADDQGNMPKHTKHLRQIQPHVWIDGMQRIVVPPEHKLTKAVIDHFHASPTEGHMGSGKTLEKIQRHFWWKGMAADVINYTAKCDSCQRVKFVRDKPLGLLNPLPVPARNWESIGMDFITDLPMTEDGYDQILVVVCRLSKMVVFAAVKSTHTAADTAQTFIDNVFKNHGLPTSIVSDRDPKFTSTFWRSLCEKLGITQLMSSPWHPSTDGISEKHVQIVSDYLRHFVTHQPERWKKYLPLAQFAHNNSRSASTQLTPFYMNYGFHPTSPASSGLHTQSPPAEDTADIINAIIKQATENMAAAQDRQKAYADAKRRPHTFQHGDMVLLSTKHLKFKGDITRKLMPRFVGPFKIIKLVGNAAVKLELPPNMRVHPVLHVSQVKPYKSDGKYKPCPPLGFIEGEPVFKVAMLHAHKRIRNKDMYLVRWENYDPVYDTWEPATNILDKSLINDYWARAGSNTHT